MLVFEERGKPEYPEKNLLEQRREPTTNWKVFLTTFCVSKTEYKSQLREVKGDLLKATFVLCNN